MTETWRNPKNWQAGEALTPAKLNTYISAQNNYLRYRNPIVIESAGGSVFTNTSATPLLISNDYEVLIDVQENEDILANFKMWAQSNTNTAISWFDLLIDNTYYLSSGLDTPLARGLVAFQASEASQYQLITHRRIIQGLTKGEHRITLTAARSANTLTMTRVAFTVGGY